jgi:hypothetical protein
LTRPVRQVGGQQAALNLRTGAVSLRFAQHQARDVALEFAKLVAIYQPIEMAAFGHRPIAAQYGSTSAASEAQKRPVSNKISTIS